VNIKSVGLQIENRINWTEKMIPKLSRACYALRFGPYQEQ